MCRFIFQLKVTYMVKRLNDFTIVVKMYCHIYIDLPTFFTKGFSIQRSGDDQMSSPTMKHVGVGQTPLAGQEIDAVVVVYPVSQVIVAVLP